MPAYVYTLEDAQNDIGIRNVVGVCNTGEQFADYVNRATRRLMKRGAWFGTDVLMRLCTNGCDVVFPRHVGTVNGIRLACSDYMQIRNNWWAILGGGVGYSAGWNTPYGGGGFGYGYGYGNGAGLGAVQGYQPPGVDTNTVPVFNQISGNTGKLLRYHVVKATDLGKKIKIFGTKFGGQPLQTLVDGVWEDGITITAATPIAQTTILVTKITSVIRDETEGMAYLYEYDQATTKQRMLAAYEPSETHPNYRHMRIPALTCAPNRVDDNGVNTWEFEALVKLQYIPVKNPGDFLIISDFDALALAIQSIKFDEANDAKNAEDYMKKAIRELNYELRDKSPAEQLSVRVQVMGSNTMLANPI